MLPPSADNYKIQVVTHTITIKGLHITLDQFLVACDEITEDMYLAKFLIKFAAVAPDVLPAWGTTVMNALNV